MTELFKTTVYLFACGARGETPSISSPVDLKKVMSCASSQGVQFLVFSALMSGISKNTVSLENGGDFNAMRFDLFRKTAGHEQRIYNLHSVLDGLEKENVGYTMIKGEILADLYACPSQRVSSDTDILIDPKDKKAAVNYFRNAGFEVDDSEYEEVVSVKRSDCGLVEIHTELYKEIFLDIWFDNEKPHTLGSEIITLQSGYKVRSLLPDENAAYISLHAMKHFLSGGLSIRHIMDMLLYMRAYKNVIDEEKYYSLLSSCKLDGLARAIIGIGVNYLGFSPDELLSGGCEKDVCEKLLSDIEKGGIFSVNEVERRDFCESYIRKRMNPDKKAAYEKKKRAVAIKKMLLPDRATLCEYMPSAKKKSALLPAAWFFRVYVLAAKKVSPAARVKYKMSGNRGHIGDDARRAREELMTSLGMV